VSDADTSSSPHAAPAPATTFRDADCAWYAQFYATASPDAAVKVAINSFVRYSRPLIMDEVTLDNLSSTSIQALAIETYFSRVGAVILKAHGPELAKLAGRFRST
jgi:hypothetical protein